LSKEKLAQVWPDWQVEEQLGKGSYGTVYKAVRRDNHIQSYAAIKVISIPSDSAEVESLRSEGLSEEGARTYFRGIVDDFVGEIRLMESLKGVQNIVSVEDYKVVESTDDLGWDIYIRMELLTPFNTYIRKKQMTEKEVIKLGIDICTALELCGRRNIVHRDIKPENIFINDFGYFKLGDFGIARKLENMTGGLSQKGTYNYMAPEVATGTKYDARVDLYSLGIVLYRLLNCNRLPFIETEQQLLNPNARKAAVERRIRGDKMNPPSQASSQVAAVIMRACAYNPESRFPDATAMKEALMKAGMGVYVETADLDKTVAVRSAARNPVPAGAGGFTPVQRPPVQPVQRPVPPVQPVQRPVPPVQPVQRSVPPVQPVQRPPVQPAQRPVPPVQPVQRPVPPVQPVQRPVPPVQPAVPNNVNRSTPPVQKPVQPAVPNNVNRSTPPIYGDPNAKAKPQAPKRLSVLCLVSFLLCPALLLLAGVLSVLESAEDIFIFSWIEIVACLVPLILSILGARSATKQNHRGKGFSVAALVLSLLFGCLAVDKMYVAMEDMYILGKGMDLICSTITCGIVIVASVVLYILARKKKK